MRSVFIVVLTLVEYTVVDKIPPCLFPALKARIRHGKIILSYVNLYVISKAVVTAELSKKANKVHNKFIRDMGMIVLLELIKMHF